MTSGKLSHRPTALECLSVRKSVVWLRCHERGHVRSLSDSCGQAEAGMKGRRWLLPEKTQSEGAEAWVPDNCGKPFPSPQPDCLMPASILEVWVPLCPLPPFFCVESKGRIKCLR